MISFCGGGKGNGPVTVESRYGADACHDRVTVGNGRVTISAIELVTVDIGSLT